MQVTVNSTEQSAEFVANELAVRAWTDAKFQAELEADRTAVVKHLCAEFGIAYDEMAFANIVVPASPAGDLPFDGLKADTTTPTVRPGWKISVTAECGCNQSETGGCSCYSIAGTPCIGCSI